MNSECPEQKHKAQNEQGNPPYVYCKKEGLAPAW